MSTPAKRTEKNYWRLRQSIEHHTEGLFAFEGRERFGVCPGNGFF